MAFLMGVPLNRLIGAPRSRWVMTTWPNDWTRPGIQRVRSVRGSQRRISTRVPLVGIADGDIWSPANQTGALRLCLVIDSPATR